MSTNDKLTCANCGEGEENSGDLKACTACKMVKYCNRNCQVAHRPQHKKACKKRAAELHDEKLFKQPPPNEDCPICFLPLPAMETGSKYHGCCGKTTCNGCIHAVAIRDEEDKCPFCRTPAPHSDEILEQMNKRIELEDAEAIYNLGCYYNNGQYGLLQNRARALELWHRAAELGCAASYCNIGIAYCFGIGVERDMKQANHYYELAAMGGDMRARHNLGCSEGHVGNHDRVLKHFMIAAGCGSKKSLSTIQEMFKKGMATREDYTQALRAYQAYLGEIKSVQRDEAAAADEDFKYYEA